MNTEEIRGGGSLLVGDMDRDDVMMNHQTTANDDDEIPDGLLQVVVADTHVHDGTGLDNKTMMEAVGTEEDLESNDVMTALNDGGETTEQTKGTRRAPFTVDKSDAGRTKGQNRQPTHQHIFLDHFTLPALSSDVRFRATNKKARVYTNNHSQFVLEETTWGENNNNGGQHNNRIVAKRVSDGTAGLWVLRATYTLVCVFFTGFLFVFCIELLLFLVLDVTIEIGVTDIQERRPAIAASTILALPIYVWGLASALVISGHYTYDTWQGHSLVKRFVFGRFVGVLTEWLSFFVFLGVPIIVCFLTLLLGLDNWWEITSMAWFSCVFLFYVVYAILIISFEVQACLEVMKNRNCYDDKVDDGTSWRKLLKTSVLLRQQRFYSGRKHVHYLTRGYIDDDEEKENDDTKEEEKLMVSNDGRKKNESVSWYSRFTQWKLLSKCGMFKPLSPPIRTYSIHDTKQVRPYITANNWSLEKIYCRPYNSRYVAIVRGGHGHALTRAQIRSSFICILLGNIFGLLLLLSLLLWSQTGTGMIVIVVLMVFICCILPSIRASYRIFTVTSDLIQEIHQYHHQKDANEDGTGMVNLTFETSTGTHKPSSQLISDPQRVGETQQQQQPLKGITPATFQSSSTENNNNYCEGIYQIYKTFRISQPSDEFCWVMLVLETVTLFLYPAICLFVVENYVIGILFVVIGTLSWLRDHLNAAVVLEESATSMDRYITGPTKSMEWQKQSRLYTIVSDISRNRSHRMFVSILCFVVVLLLALFGFAIGNSEGTDGYNEKVVTPLPNFMYEQQQDNLEYPSCTLSKGFGISNSPTTELIDYVFLAKLAYQDPNLTQTLLDDWFGGSSVVATDMEDFVQEYKREKNVPNVVSFKFIYFNESKLGLVSLRGTVNAWDALTDVQLWSAAAVFQGLRFVLPFGEVWNPILDNMVTLVSWLQSASISKVAFYRETTKFVEYLKDETTTTTTLPVKVDTVQLTGHSLGGGLAIITGAQTDTPAVAISGPNAKLSRHTFKPPLTVDALDTRTFNVIPDRDLVPRLDDRARLFQEIRCTAPINNLAACHDSTRTLCEVLYSCGTRNRPAICECAVLYGYERPIPINNNNSSASLNNNRTFEEECKNVIMGSTETNG